MADLTTNKRKSIEALLVASSVREAAKIAGLGERTIYRYMADDEFKAELQARQDAILTGTTAALVGLTYEAIENLRLSMAVLRDHLNASLGDFVQVDDRGTWSVDLRKAEQAGLVHYVKKLDYDKDGNTRIEIHDAQAAARMLGHLALGILDERRRQLDLEELVERIAALEAQAGV
jgi:hypothetical protein